MNTKDEQKHDEQMHTIQYNLVCPARTTIPIESLKKKTESIISKEKNKIEKSTWYFAICFVFCFFFFLISVIFYSLFPVTFFIYIMFFYFLKNDVCAKKI
jgi:hypothetical protein